MLKTNQKKKTYSNSYDDVFRACQSALAKLSCRVTETKGNYFHIRIGFLPYFFGYNIELYLLELPDKQTEVSVIAKTGLLLFGRPKKTVERIFRKIDSVLDYQKWQKAIHPRSIKDEI